MSLPVVPLAASVPNVIVQSGAIAAGPFTIVIADVPSPLSKVSVTVSFVASEIVPSAPLEDGSFAVQVGGRAYRYAFGGGEWKAGERLGALDGCYVVADGGLVAVAAGAAGEVRLFADGDQFRELCRIDALAAPRRLAMRNGRLVVWEAAAQRISSYEIETESM